MERLSSHGTATIPTTNDYISTIPHVCVHRHVGTRYIVLFNYVYRMGLEGNAACMHLFLMRFPFMFISQMGNISLRNIFHILFITSIYGQLIP
jgi:hypothetical protein